MKIRPERATPMMQETVEEASLRRIQILKLRLVSNTDQHDDIDIGDGGRWVWDPEWREEDGADWHDTFTN